MLPWTNINVEISINYTKVARTPYVRIDDTPNPKGFEKWLYGATVPQPGCAYLIDYQQYLYELQQGASEYWD